MDCPNCGIQMTSIEQLFDVTLFSVEQPEVSHCGECGTIKRADSYYAPRLFELNRTQQLEATDGAESE